MLTTIEGLYRHGRVELEEAPPVVSPTRVIVTFLEPPTASLALSKEELQRRAFRRMREGLDLGGPPYPSREELHERDGH